VTGDRPWLLLVLSAALLLWSPGNRLALGRLRLATGSGIRRASWRGGIATTPTGRRRSLAGAAGVATGLLLGGGLGLLAGMAVAVTTERLLRRSEPDDDAALRAAVLRDLPGACDLLGVCLAAGLPVGGALHAVGSALPEPLGRELLAVAALYRLGAEPRRAWADVVPELSGLGRTMIRAGESGASVGPALAALASDTRAAARARVDADVRRAGVWVLAPLGLCFLPAFLCLGVVPLVLGIAGDVFR
jgi:pilus assembly protein TadC